MFHRLGGYSLQFITSLAEGMSDMSLALASLLRSRPARAMTTTAAVLALTLVMSGCSSSDNPPASSGTGGSGSAAGLDDVSPGVTATTIKIGFLFTDLGAVRASLGFKQEEYGDTTKQITAYVNYINANGGLGGRQIIPVIKAYEGSQDSPEFAESFCNAFTQDEQVFGLVFEGQLQNNVRPCYSSRKTVMIDQGLFTKDQAEFERYSPYLWSPVFPEYGSLLKSQLQILQSQSWFAGSKGVSIIGVDSDVARRPIDQTVVPFLATAGVTNYQKYFVDTSNPGTLGDGSSQALLSSKNAGLDRVIVVGGTRILPVAVSTSEAADLTGAKWSVSTYDSPLFLQDNPDTIVGDTLIGMLGMGVLPDADIREDVTLPFPNPANSQEILCKQIIDNAGVSPLSPARTAFKTAFMYCDGLFFLKGAIDKAPKNLTPTAFRDAAFSLGTTYRSSQTFGSLMSQGKYSATNTGRAIFFDSTCVPVPASETKGCFRYTGGDIPLS